ncbi:MAG TPA: CHAD domain-containing protein [Steroidobacteraceae bacterium]|jgi:CHAD domain-containing protein|nr:CHAD domain-containing protein [Steroidobacteraceae bacterium]
MLSSHSLSDTTVHDARKEIRRSRAAVRLLRVALGRARFRRENARLRDAGRALNEARDAKVLVSTLDSLRKCHPQLERDHAFAALSERLREQQRTSRRHLNSAKTPSIAAACRTLEQTQFSASRWPVGNGGWRALGPAFRRVYAAGRVAARKSRTRPDEHQMHEWRKQVKYLRHALQVFAPLRPSKLKKHARLARRLAESLGDGHDLALLRDSAVSGANRPALKLKPLLAAIDARRRALRKQSLELAERVYAHSPHQMDKRLQRYWHRWRDQD